MFCLVTLKKLKQIDVSFAKQHQESSVKLTVQREWTSNNQ